MSSFYSTAAEVCLCRILFLVFIMLKVLGTCQAFQFSTVPWLLMLPSKVVEIREKLKWDTYRFSVLQFQHTPLTQQCLLFKLAFVI